MKVLFVCHANVCRSFMAQELLKSFCPQLTVFSRGLYVDPAVSVPETVQRFLIDHKVAVSSYVPVQLSQVDLEQADLVLFMEKQHLEHVIDRFAQYTDKCYLLLDFAYGQEKDVADPIGLKGHAFNRQADILYQAVRACGEKLNHS